MERSDSLQSKRLPSSKTSECSGIVAGAGLVAMDLVMEGQDTSQICRWAGGSCGNVLTILSTLDWESFPIARLGHDRAADIIREDLEYWGVQTQLATSTSSGSTPIIIQRNSRGNHSFEFQCPDCQAYLPRFKRPLVNQTSNYVSEVPTADMFYFDRAVPAALRLAEYFRSEGALIVFEPNNSTERDLFERAVTVSHILKHTDDADIDLLNVDDPWLRIETLGASGLKFQLEGGAWQMRDGFQIDSVSDSSGAGDWCSAGLMHVIGKHWSGDINTISPETIDQGLAYGQALAALNCLYKGGRGILYGIAQNQLTTALQEPTEYLGKKSSVSSSSIIGAQHSHTKVATGKISKEKCFCESVCSVKPVEKA